VTRTPHDGRRSDRADSLAMLVRSVPVRLVEVSRGGCLLECPRRLESGTSGVLAVELAGLLRTDDIRVARCQARAGAGPTFHVGAELLTTKRLGRRTIRLAVGTIIDGARDAARAAHGRERMSQGQGPPKEASSRSDGRAPPDMPDRGS
jgi:hypothetical protein